LAVIPDAEMLADPNVVFPVVIDPFFVGERLHWANVHREQPSRGWTSDSAWPRAGGMRVGLCTWSGCGDSWGLWRSVVRFETGLGGRHIISAAVKMTQTHTGGCGTYPLRMWRVGAFTSGVSWNGVSWLDGAPLQSVNVASSNSTGGCGTSYPNRAVTFNSSAVRQLIQDNADESFQSVNFGLRSGDESDRNQWRRISRDSLKLEVEHASYPQTPTSLSTDGKGCGTSTPGPWVTTRRPGLTGTPRNQDGNGRYRQEVQTSGGSASVHSFLSSVVTVNISRTHTIPAADALPDGSYRWRMRTESANSGVPASSYTGWCYFRVDATPPPEPSATQLTQGPQQGDPVQFELTGSSDTDRFRYSISGGSNTTVTASNGVATIIVNPPTTSIDHQLQVWALDAAGNLSGRHDLWFTTAKDLRVPVAGTWRFDGDRRDDSGHGHDLTAGPGVSFTTDREGRSASAMQFTAQPGGCLSTGDPVLDTNNSFTVAAWVRMTDGGAAGTNPTVVSQAGEYRSAFYIAWDRSTGKWQFTMPSADAASVTWTNAYSIEPAELGQWTHVAGVHDAAAGRIRLYVDGNLQAVSEAHSSMWNASGPIRIGCAIRQEGEISNEVDGAIDDVVAYQGVLAGAQVQDLMARGVPAGQVSWWPLRGSGVDDGPAGSDLTVPGSVTWVPDSHGRTGSAMQLDGASCAATAGPVARTDHSFTVSAWARLGSGDPPMTVVSQAGVNNTAFRLGTSADGRWGFAMAASDEASPTQHAVYASAGATAVGEWQYVVGQYDAAAGKIKVFVDGVEQGVSDAPAGMWRSSGSLHVGCVADAGGTSEHFGGAVHDVRVWRGVATPEQVSAAATELLSVWGLDLPLGGGRDSVGGNDLSPQGQFDWVADRSGLPTFIATALAFDGAGWAETSGPVMRTDESFTVSAWAKLEDKGAARTVAAQAGATESSFSLGYEATADRWQFGMPSEDSSSAVLSTAVSQSAPAVGVWYHLTGVFDLGANEIRLYVNGALQESAPGPGAPWHTDGEFLLGSAGDNSGGRWDPMVGAVDLARAYSGVLDDQLIFEQGFAPQSAALGVGVAVVEQGSFETTVAEVPVVLTEPASEQVTVDYESVTPEGPGYATSPDDFEAVAGTLVFEPGEQSKTIPVTVNGDPDQVGDLLALVELGDAANAVVGDTGEGGVWIKAYPPSSVVPVIDTPSGAEQWGVGEQISFSGHATEAGAALPADALSWELRLEDCSAGTCVTETVQEWTGVARGSFVTPDVGYPAHLELELVADNGYGGIEATTVQLDPAVVDLTFDSVPQGLELTVDSQQQVAPSTRTVIQGSSVDVAAPAPQSLDTVAYVFDSWSDGGAQAHVITAPTTAATFMATYVPEGPGVNLALDAPVTADVSSCSGVEGPASAVNGSDTDKWCSSGDPAWLRVDLGAVTAIGNITLRHAGAGAEEPEKNTRDFLLKVSDDGINWTTVAQVAGNTADVTSHDTVVTGRYVQLDVLTPNSFGNDYARIYELEVYANAVGSSPAPPEPTGNLAWGRPATADAASCSDPEGPQQAVNGSWTGGGLDKWCSSGDSAWLQVDLGAVTGIGNITLRHAGAGGEAPEKNTRDFLLKVSDDGAAWTTVAQVTGNTDDVTSHDMTASGRYVQLEVLTPNSYGNEYTRIYQLEVYPEAGQ
jgi:hypothetical protein